MDMANCYECQLNPNSYHCAACGEHAANMYCHYAGEPDGFTCKKGKENHQLFLKGLPNKWEYGDLVK